MATHLPTKLKSTDLARYNLRATQLEKAKPVIAYWCEYWIVNQILSKGLQADDSEVLQFTTELMDKLEETKAQNPMNEAIMDEVAGQAYVEQFGMETFMRAERTLQANKATKQTADTFLAAATFLELQNIWTPLEADMLSKIKYAKWNAVRIMKALKEGQDPNDTNPHNETHVIANDLGSSPGGSNGQQDNFRQPYVEEVTDDQSVFENRMARQSSLNESLHPSAQASTRASPHPPHEAFVQEVPDEQDQVQATLAAHSNIDQSLHPSEQVSARSSPVTHNPTAQMDDEVSPIEPSPNEKEISTCGGYFPHVPSIVTQTQKSSIPTAPAPEIVSFPSNLDQNQTPQIPSVPRSPGPQLVQRTIPNEPAQSSAAPYRKPLYSPPTNLHGNSLTNSQLNTDDVAIAKAQKHARFAISALNFEDAATAVKELRAALQTLGAQ